ncbi:MAG: glycosyltransferase [Pirellulales bacterium]|jgi:glycosyltransferase involved in cell wall biosynthesis
MRVLHLSTWNRPCGIATYCGNLVRSLDAIGVRNDVYPLEPHLWRTYTADDIADLQADIAEQSRRYDLVHIQHEHGFFGHAVSYKAAARNYGTMLKTLRAAGTPVVTTFHTEPLGVGVGDRRRSFSPQKMLRNLNRRLTWNRQVSRCFGVGPLEAKAVVHTPTTRRALIKQGMPAGAVHVVEHGCLPQREAWHNPAAAKEQLGLSPDDVLLTMFGFIGRYKGHDVAVRALAKLPSHFHLAICGGAHPEADDEFLDKLIKLVRHLGVEDRVTITGWLAVEATDVYYAATDICLAPYVDPNLSASGAITWALASGKPTIGSKVPAFQNICREQPCMLLTTPKMEDEIVWAAQKLAADPVQSANLVAAAGRYIDTYSWESTARVTENLYASMISGEPVTASGIGRGRLVARTATPATIQRPQSPLIDRRGLLAAGGARAAEPQVASRTA